MDKKRTPFLFKKISWQFAILIYILLGLLIFLIETWLVR
jgi:hypothetical protein